jgi:DMSO/TMAO reductase YedYZ heme-binding membrane subunit
MNPSRRMMLFRSGGILLGLLVGLLVILTVGSDIAQSLNGVHTGWYLSSSTGLVAYFLSWLSTFAGLMITGRQAQQWPGVFQANDIHRQASLASVIMMSIHITVLLLDGYIGYTWQSLFIPSPNGPYLPFAVALGQIAFPLIVVVIVTAEWRSTIGKAWRWIHAAAFFTFFAGALHGILAGSDTRVSMISLMYVLTISSTLFMTAYRVFFRTPLKATGTA